MVLTTLAFGLAVPAGADTLPHIESRDGRHALIVDGRPFLILGAQANNSSNYPAMLETVFPLLGELHANTLEMPVAWEQVEPVEGRFDFSFVDALLAQARAHDKRLVLLWFGTWKNTSASYVPEWVKTDTRRFPRMRTKDGAAHYVLSPHSRATLEADKRAFVRLMEHLKASDPDHTVIMVQVENESGAYGQLRDYGPEAEALFDGPVPAAAGRTGSWAEAFGEREWTWLEWDPPEWADDPVGGGVVAQLGPDEFLIAGDHVRMRFALAAPETGEQMQILSAEQGTFEEGRWVMRRRWNGDQIDYGFNFTEQPVLLRVRLGTYR